MQEKYLEEKRKEEEKLKKEEEEKLNASIRELSIDEIKSVIE